MTRALTWAWQTGTPLDLAAPSAGSTNLLSRLQLRTSSPRLGSGLHSGLDLAGHGQERLLHVGGVLRGSFDELDTQRISEFLSLIVGDHSLRG